MDKQQFSDIPEPMVRYYVNSYVVLFNCHQFIQDVLDKQQFSDIPEPMVRYYVNSYIVLFNCH